MSSDQLRLCLFGAGPDTGNLGVSALMTATVLGVAARRAQADVTVFDHGLGVRHGMVHTPGSTVTYRRLGARVGRRYHRPEHLATMRLCARLGGLGNPGATAVRDATAVLDVSGGDSFTDLYGPARFELITRSKLLALQLGTPLVLLPQTLGPFRTSATRDLARRIISAAHLVYARGADSFQVLGDMLGDDFDAARHRQGVDLAFAMPAEPPAAAVQEWLVDADADSAPIVGLNVSGLLYSDPGAADAYGLACDYRAVVTAVLRHLLAAGAQVVLVPHVIGAAESDRQACLDLARSLSWPERLLVAPDGLDAPETKWLIGQLDWFCGTRMHATIAALSSGVPAAAIAYSAKTREVFDSCGLGTDVADARTLGTEAIVAAVLTSWEHRGRAATILRDRLPATLQAAEAQMDAIVDAVGQPCTRDDVLSPGVS